MPKKVCFQKTFLNAHKLGRTSIKAANVNIHARCKWALRTLYARVVDVNSERIYLKRLNNLGKVPFCMETCIA